MSMPFIMYNSITSLETLKTVLVLLIIRVSTLQDRNKTILDDMYADEKQCSPLVLLSQHPCLDTSKLLNNNF
jgi:hypothetical protein